MMVNGLWACSCALQHCGRCARFGATRFRGSLRMFSNIAFSTLMGHLAIFSLPLPNLKLDHIATQAVCKHPRLAGFSKHDVLHVCTYIKDCVAKRLICLIETTGGWECDWQVHQHHGVIRNFRIAGEFSRSLAGSNLSQSREVPHRARRTRDFCAVWKGLERTNSVWNCLPPLRSLSPLPSPPNVYWRG